MTNEELTVVKGYEFINDLMHGGFDDGESLQHAAFPSNYKRNLSQNLLTYAPKIWSANTKKTAMTIANFRGSKAQIPTRILNCIKYLKNLSQERVDSACKNIDKIANEISAGKRSKQGPFTAQEAEDLRIYTYFLDVLLYYKNR